MRSENKSFSMGRFAGSLIGRQKGLTAVLILLVVAAAVSGLVPPLILGNVVDRLSGSSDTTMIAGTLLGAGLLYFLTIFLSRGLEAAREIVLTIWGGRNCTTGSGNSLPTSFPACLLPTSSHIRPGIRSPALRMTWIHSRTSSLPASSVWRRTRPPSSASSL